MRIDWGRVVLAAVLCGLILLLARGLLLARCAPEPELSRPTPAPDEPVALTLYDHRAETSETVELEAYIVGVVAAEMPASFPLEALKAQAVAARTYAVHHVLCGGCRQYGTDICTSSACCQAYCSDARMKERWGGAYEENRAKMARAVTETAGLLLLYEGEPIDALYHSASGGQTENAEDVYDAALPYLRSVMSTAESGTDRLTGEKTLTRKAFAALVNERWPKAKLSAARLERQLAVSETTPTGRVKSVRLNGVTVTGRQLRSLLSLDSTLFTFTLSKESIVFCTRGYGHGVGMSQTGANAMALGGRSYEEILHYYYTDVAIGTFKIR